MFINIIDVQFILGFLIVYINPSQASSTYDDEFMGEYEGDQYNMLSMVNDLFGDSVGTNSYNNMLDPENRFTNAHASIQDVGHAQAQASMGGESHASVYGQAAFAHAITNTGNHGTFSFADQLFGQSYHYDFHWRRKRSLFLSRLRH